MLFQPELLQNLSGFLLERSWGSPGHPVTEGWRDVPPLPPGVELGCAVGTNMGKRGAQPPHSVPGQDWPQRGHKTSCFPQEERETGSRSLGKVKYHPRSFCPTGGTRSCPAQPDVPPLLGGSLGSP